MLKNRTLWILFLFILIVALTYNEAVLGQWLAPLTDATANIAFLCIEFFGLDLVRSAGIISLPGEFAYDIYFRCTGILPVACLCLLIVLSNGKRQDRLFGVVIGSAAILFINMVRLVCLFLAGVYHPEYFSFAHDVVGEGMMVLSILGLWLLWKWKMGSKSVTAINPSSI